MIRYLSFHRKNVTDFLGAPALAHAGHVGMGPDDPAPRHVLRQITHLSTETLSIWPRRLATNRGNAYLAPGALSRIATDGIFPNFDCKNTDFSGNADPDEDEVRLGEPSAPDVNGGIGVTASFAPCIIQGDYPNSPLGNFGDDRFPQLFADP